MPGFLRIVPNNLIHAADVNQIIDALDGASGAGIPISITAVNDQTNFALTVQNDDPTNQRALNVLNPAGVPMIRVDSAGVTLGGPLSLPPNSLTGQTVGGILTGTLPNPGYAPGTINMGDVAGQVSVGQLSPGSAAANVGTLGGVLSGTLPNPGYTPGTINFVGIAGLVATGQLSPGSAAANVGTLGGDLNGSSLPNPLLAAGVVTQYAQYAAQRTGSTTSTSFGLITGPAASVSMTTTGGPVLVFGMLPIYNNTANTIGSVGFQRDGTAAVILGTSVLPTVNEPCMCGSLYVDAPAAGAHVWSLGWYTNGGTLSMSSGANTVLIAVELKH